LAFRRAFNALRCSAPAIVPAFAEFRHLVQRDSRAVSNAACTFVAMAETEVERRGEFRAWPFADVDWLMAALGDLARIVLGALDRAATPIVPDHVLGAFQTRSAALHDLATLPYSGCRHCDSPCRFRFDMAHVEPKASRDFQQAYLNLRVPTGRLAQIARAAATRSFFISDVSSCSGAALCFGIQELASPALGVSTYHQLGMARVLKQQLAIRG
jgi:hypothetical protein